MLFQDQALNIKIVDRDTVELFDNIINNTESGERELYMKEHDVALNPNRLVHYLKKPACEFTRNDIVTFIEAAGIQMLNFRYIGEDGKLKQLNFAINSRRHLEEILTAGKRVDGSSLFSYVDAGSSDLYVIPRYKTAFVNPFAEIPTLDILCSFYDFQGNPS